MDIRRSIRNYYPAFILLISLTAFSFYTYFQLNSSLKSRREKLFEQRATRVRELLNKRITDYVQILKGCQSLYYASDTLTSQQWKIYVKNLDLSTNYPGIQAVAFAAWIKNADIPALEKKIKRDGHPEFEIKSAFNNKYLTPIIFIEPFSGRNLRAFGFDMYGESIRREAMNKAMLSGKPTLTRKVTLVQETNQNIQPGFLLFLPVYRDPQNIRTPGDKKNSIQGFIYSPFRAEDLMKSVFKNHPHLHIEIYDGRKSKNNLLYDSNPQAALKQNELSLTNTIPVAGINWTLIVSPNETFGAHMGTSEPALALIFGLAITCVVVMISINTIKNKTRVVEELMLSKQVEKKKDEFIGIAAHELKTPLTNIKAYIQLLERTDLGEKERSFVSKASSQIIRLGSLITDLLDVSKIQAGTLQFNINEFLLSALIEDSIETVKHMYQSHQIILNTDVPDVNLQGDLFRLEQALTNLLINAIKYSPGANQVFVTAIQTSDEIIIEVKDEGIGISEKNQKHIFEKFYRADGLSPALSGLGMGLYISFEIVRRHKGIISVKSEPQKGSTFSIHLPLIA